MQIDAFAAVYSFLCEMAKKPRTDTTARVAKEVSQGEPVFAKLTERMREQVQKHRVRMLFDALNRRRSD